MSKNTFIAINGRTMKQGRGLHHGKDSSFYQNEVGSVEMNSEDMEMLNVSEGTTVNIRNDYGHVELTCRPSSGLPRGLVFIPYGPQANCLVGTDTGGTGMPSFKGLEVEIW